MLCFKYSPGGEYPNILCKDSVTKEVRAGIGIKKRKHWHKKVNCGGEKLALEI